VSLEGPFPVNAAMMVVPLPHAKEELTKWMPMLRKLLRQRERMALHTNSSLQIRTPRPHLGSCRQPKKVYKNITKTLTEPKNGSFGEF